MEIDKDSTLLYPLKKKKGKTRKKRQVEEKLTKYGM